jgi:hypothetical protein
MYTWKFHKENSYVAILNKQKCHFFFSTKLDYRMIEHVLPGGDWYQWEGGGREMVKESECGANSVYTCMEMEK